MSQRVSACSASCEFAPVYLPRSLRVSCGRQRGVVLPIVIILMVILAVLAMSGMGDTALQERMSGNLRDRETAFQAAESALRLGEAWAQDNRAAAAAHTPMSGSEAAQWDGQPPQPTDFVVRGVELYDNEAAISLFDRPWVYVGPPQLLRVNPGELPPEFRELYPVISRAFGATNDTIVILRSTFEPL